MIKLREILKKILIYFAFFKFIKIEFIDLRKLVDVKLQNEISCTKKFK
jgi:hypothetical protein